jgi:hypothetical protein
MKLGRQSPTPRRGAVARFAALVHVAVAAHGHWQALGSPGGRQNPGTPSSVPSLFGRRLAMLSPHTARAVDRHAPGHAASSVPSQISPG